MSQFYFAWVDHQTDNTFGPEHEVEDEEIFALTITHQEGELPLARIDVVNPRIGLLNPGRKQWAWIAWQGDGTTGPTPLFFGRLVGFPQDLDKDVVTLEFAARPIDMDDQRQAAAAALKVRPYWDPVWIPPETRSDPDAALEARPVRWHVDRVTHEVTVSDINSGEDGTLDLAGDYFYDSLTVQPMQPPGRRVKMRGEVFWEQRAVGEVSLTRKLLDAARNASSGNGQNIDTYTGGGLALDWPREGDDIGGDWSVGQSYVVRGNGKWVPVEFETVILNNGQVADFPSWSFRPVFNVRYDTARSRRETVTFTLEADVQALLTDPGDEEEISISLASQELNEPIDDIDITADGNAPIEDERRKSYFKTDRGRWSLEYLICLARANLLARARAVEITLQTRWENGLDLSCRKNVSIDDPRIPGGTAAGKVIGYTLSADGDSGELVCGITMACTIGQGNTVSESAGTPDYVDEDYVETGYQTYTGQIVMPIAGEVTYSDFSSQAVDDDGVDFFNMSANDLVSAITIDGTKAEQRAVLQAFRNDFNEAAKALNQIFTQITVELVPLNTGPFETAFAVEVSNLMIPKTIDLEAASG